MFRYSFKILPDRLKLIRLYPCGSLGQSISFVFGARVGHFAATPQSDVVGIWSRDLGVMATLSVRQKMPFFRAFITLRSQFHRHHRSQRALTEIVSKTLDLSFKSFRQEHTKPLLKALHWLPISDRITNKLSCMCYNSVIASTPQYLADLLQIYTPSRTLRSTADTRKLKIPLFKKKYSGQRSFSYPAGFRYLDCLSPSATHILLI